jgi:hypothetical protein
MKVFFHSDSLAHIKDAIDGVLKGLALPVVVRTQATLSELIVTIQKLGTTYLTFSAAICDDGIKLELAHEEVSLVHRSQIEYVKIQITDIIVKAGGVVCT